MSVNGKKSDVWRNSIFVFAIAIAIVGIRIILYKRIRIRIIKVIHVSFLTAMTKLGMRLYGGISVNFQSWKFIEMS